MTSDAWSSKGCPVCRRQWESGDPPPTLSVSLLRHASLRRCAVCATLWEENERYADVIDEADARRFYPEAFQELSGDHH